MDLMDPTLKRTVAISAGTFTKWPDQTFIGIVGFNSVHKPFRSAQLSHFSALPLDLTQLLLSSKVCAWRNKNVDIVVTNGMLEFLNLLHVPSANVTNNLRAKGHVIQCQRLAGRMFNYKLL